MKKIVTLFLALLFLGSCSNEINYDIDERLFTQTDSVLLFNNKPFTGLVFSHHEKDKNLNFAWKEHYKNGVRSGLREVYNRNGQPLEISNWKNGKFHGQFQSYHENGVLKEDASFDNGEPTGLFTLYYDNGEIECQKNYVNGLLSGAYIENFVNGTPKIKGFYKNNERDSSWVKYIERQGRPISAHIMGSYKDGKRDGEWNEFQAPFYGYSLVVNYTDGKRNGEWKKIQRGRIDTEGFFKDDKPHGLWRHYALRAEGKFAGSYYEGYFDNGDIVPGWNCHFQDGSLKEAMEYYPLFEINEIPGISVSY